MKNLLWLTLLLLSAKNHALTFEAAIDLAIKNDHQLKAFSNQAEAWQASGEGIALWPNPTVNLGLMNVAADDFDLGQEAMSMAQVKVTQRLPKKNLINIQKRQANLNSHNQKYLLQDLKAKLKQQVGALWLQAHWAQTQLTLLHQQKSWLEQLKQTVTNHYQSGRKQTQQADVLQVDLAVQSIQQQFIEVQQKLNNASLSLGVKTGTQLKEEALLDSLPSIKPPETKPDFKQHPKVKFTQTNVLNAELAIDAAKESNKSNWAISAAYGHRRDDDLGRERADLASIGISFDLPLFNRKHNDSKVRQAALQADAQQAQWQQLLLDLNNQWAQTLNQYQSQEQLYQLHQSQLIPQSQAVIDALMIAYSNGRSDIDAVLKAQQQLINQQLSAVSAKHQHVISGLALTYLQTTDLQKTKLKNKGAAQ